jgi:hypothetical protein
LEVYVGELIVSEFEADDVGAARLDTPSEAFGDLRAELAFGFGPSIGEVAGRVRGEDLASGIEVAAGGLELQWRAFLPDGMGPPLRKILGPLIAAGERLPDGFRAGGDVDGIAKDLVAGHVYLLRIAASSGFL